MNVFYNPSSEKAWSACHKKTQKKVLPGVDNLNGGDFVTIRQFIAMSNNERSM